MVTSLLVIGHFIGDFVLQSSKTAAEKQRYRSKLFNHCLLYTFVMAAVLLASSDLENFGVQVIVIGLSHLAIDFARAFYDKRANDRDQLFSYFADQILHFTVIFIVAGYFGLSMHPGGFLQLVYNRFGIPRTNNCITYALIYLTMLQPTAVTVKKVLIYISSRESGDKGSEATSQYNAGYIIGILERIIIATLVLQNQLSAIGLVLAAKSLARFNQLNDKSFAEKYLVGSLTSIAASIIATLVLKGMLI